MKEKLSHLSSVVHEYMKKADNFGRTLTVKIKSSDFKIITRSRTFHSELRKLEDLIQISHEILENTKEEIKKVRLLGISISNLEKESQTEGIQLEFDFEK